jgi:hypothetical protein
VLSFPPLQDMTTGSLVGFLRGECSTVIPCLDRSALPGTRGGKVLRLLWGVNGQRGTQLEAFVS